MGYKALPDQIKDYKSKEEIDKLIVRTEAAMQQKEPEDFSSALSVLQEKNSSLIDDKYFRGELFPLIQDYLPKDMVFLKKKKLLLLKA